MVVWCEFLQFLSSFTIHLTEAGSASGLLPNNVTSRRGGAEGGGGGGVGGGYSSGRDG